MHTVTFEFDRWHRVQAEYLARAAGQDYRTWLYEQHQITGHGWIQTQVSVNMKTTVYKVQFENDRAAALFVLKY
jgi:hypothetical protein